MGDLPNGRKNNISEWVLEVKINMDQPYGFVQEKKNILYANLRKRCIGSNYRQMHGTTILM